jgi:para-nitrobenzyl esterase
MLRETRVENGRVRGIPAADPRITAFKGIPFAAPPVGELRWRAPQPALDWDGVRDCFLFGPAAMQGIPGLTEGLYTREWHVDPTIPISEDCLQLNVWTPAKSADEKLPVMVWIYGGGLKEGYPAEMEFDGERIARRGVILVSINYRVNVFGFFAHPELTAAAGDRCFTNFGFYDQRAGIRWVKRNIAAFGGDPNNITIFGQSAGGRSTLFQLLSPLNDTDHIKRAISMSGGGIALPGSSMMDYPELAAAEKTGEKFLAFLGVKTVADARKIDAVTLRDKMVEFNHMWGAVVDKVFLPDQPADLLAANKRLQVPLMAGHTTGDMFDLFGRVKTAEEFAAFARSLIGDKADRFLELCDYASGDLAKMQAACQINGQRFGVELLNMRGADAGLPAYFYSFGPEVPGWDNPGAFHSCDLWFVFESLAKCWRPFVGKHYDLARQMCNYWTNFAKNGNPNGLDADGAPMPEWKAFTAASPFAMNFHEVSAMDDQKELPAAQYMLDAAADLLWRKK